MTETYGFELTSTEPDFTDPIDLTITRAKINNDETNIRVIVAPEELNHDEAAYRLLRKMTFAILGHPDSLVIVRPLGDFGEEEAMDIVSDATAALEIQHPEFENLPGVLIP
ncbi:hypothetical protein ACWG8W_06460 [Citricoccus zhacaiensis]